MYSNAPTLWEAAFSDPSVRTLLFVLMATFVALSGAKLIGLIK